MTTNKETLDQRNADNRPMGSGWSIVSSATLSIDMFETKPLKGSSYIPTPEKLKSYMRYY